jgi:hypothetical protein
MHAEYFLLLSCAFVGHISHSQTDTTFVADSVAMERQLENILEQSQEEEDSPLPDLIAPKEYATRSFIQVRSRLVESLEKAEGFSSGAYLGSRVKSYQRVKFSTMDHFTGGLVMEKDAGEQRVTDFIAGNVSLSNYGLVSKLTIGDYFIEAGQGLALWRSYDVSKGANVLVPVQRTASGLSPYVSSGEGQFLRGIAAEVAIPSFSVLLFFSNRSRSGTIDTNGVLRSFYDLGYFRTGAELKKRNAVTERQIGTRIRYGSTGAFSVGGVLYWVGYSRNISMNTVDEIIDDRMYVASLDFSYKMQSVMVSSEVATSMRSVAGIGNLILSPSEKLDLIVSARYYPPRYFSANGLGFGEVGSNEQGFYLGLVFQPLVWCRVSSYFDQYKLNKSISMPSPPIGNDYLTNIECFLGPGISIAFRFHRKIGSILQASVNEYGLEDEGSEVQRKENIRISIDYKVSARTTIRCRVEYVTLGTSGSRINEKGLLTYQDIVFRPARTLSVNFRTAYCKGDSYLSGVSEYERDLEGVLTQPILYGSMVRWYILIKYAISREVECSLKYMDAVRDNVKRIGTGLDQLPGNRDAKIGVQIDINL